jgi:hypothetical protein
MATGFSIMVKTTGLEPVRCIINHLRCNHYVSCWHFAPSWPAFAMCDMALRFRLSNSFLTWFSPVLFVLFFYACNTKKANLGMKKPPC